MYLSNKLECSLRNHEHQFRSRWGQKTAFENALRRTISVSGYIEAPLKNRV
jgi:hypothetical protein